MEPTHPQTNLSTAALLSYRPWRGRLGGPWRGTWAVARLGLAGLVRRKLVWILYVFSLLIFFSFFFGQYLLIWAGSQLGEENVRMGGFVRVAPQELVKGLRDSLKLNGSGETFRNLFWYEGSILVVTLALVGAQLIGNDFRHRSLPFYLSKPLAARHYVIGKCLAVAAVVAAMTAVPALLLYVEFGLLDSWEYFWEARRSLFGILGYGLLLCGMMSLLLVAVTSWVQKTVPLVMFWSGLFVMAPAVAQSMAVLTGRPMYHLIDLWDCAYIVGNAMLGTKVDNRPPVWAAATVIAIVCTLCLFVLYARIRAVEVV